MSVPRAQAARRLGALALFAIACAVSPSVREMVGGQPVGAPAPMSLLSFCLAAIALALVIRSAIGDRRRGRARPSPIGSERDQAG